MYFPLFINTQIIEGGNYVMKTIITNSKNCDYAMLGNVFCHSHLPTSR